MKGRSGFIRGAVLALAGILPVAMPIHGQERPRVAVIDFDNRTDWWGQQLGKSAASQLTVALVRSGEFVVLERQQVEAVYDEWARGQSGAVTPESAMEIGRLLGAEYLITGEFTNFNINERGGRLDTGRLGLNLGRVGASETRAESAMNARVISVTSWEIVAATQQDGNEVLGRGLSTEVLSTASRTEFNQTLADQALGPVVEKIVEDLLDQKDRIVSTGMAGPTVAPAIAGMGNDGSVYIDQGQNVGMEVGRRFNVLRVVDEIRDSAGNLLDQVTERVGVIEVSRVLSQSSIATVVEGEVAEGDVLEPAGG